MQEYLSDKQYDLMAKTNELALWNENDKLDDIPARVGRLSNAAPVWSQTEEQCSELCGFKAYFT